jgi:hypothetical protein
MDGRLLVLSHEAAVTLHIGTENGRKSTFKMLRNHVNNLHKFFNSTGIIAESILSRGRHFQK